MEERSASLATWLYYRLKPFVPKSLRWMIRRRRAEFILQRNFQSWPILNEAGRPPTSWVGWPLGKRFCLVITHDVEGSVGLSRVRDLAGLEKTAGFRSSYNFVPEGQYEVLPELRNWLTDSGFEVGVHDLEHDGRLYDSRKSFSEKADKINSYIREWGASGFRSAFMLRRLGWLHELEIDYDSSTFDTDPFEPQPEGCATIFPFFIENPEAGDRSGYVELPYTLPQDSTLFLLLGEKTPEVWLRKLDWIAEQGGMALVNIHPDYIDFRRSGKCAAHQYPVECIEEFFDHIKERYAGQFWNPKPQELASWFRGSDRSDSEPSELSKLSESEEVSQ